MTHPSKRQVRSSLLVSGQHTLPVGNKTHYHVAHRDLKPGNILIGDDGLMPLLTDFGSIKRARIAVKSRRDAMMQEELAAEYSTMPYRAPELYEVQPGKELNEKVDIWVCSSSSTMLSFL